MRRHAHVPAALVMALLVTGCPPATGPDLVVPFFTAGTPVLVNTGTVAAPAHVFEVPVNMTVRNDGTDPAGIFRVALMCTEDGSEPFPVAFYMAGQASPFYPQSDAWLDAGQTVVFYGTARFATSMGGSTLSLWSIADRCQSGDPSYCQVQESNEGNNMSEPVTVVLLSPGL